MSPAQVASVIIICTFIVAGLTAIAAYLRSINGQVPNAIASGIEAGLSSLRKGPINLLPVGAGAIPNQQLATAPTVLEAGGPLASTVKPWYPAAYIPQWSQIGAVLPDGRLDPEEYSDCGETCVCMIVAGVHGVPMDPGGVRQYLHGPAGTGLTNATELVAALRHYSTASHVEAADGAAAWGIVQRIVALERPVIMLGRWADVQGAMHWQVAVSAAPDRIYYVNPFGGTRSYTLKGDWLLQYAGELVVLDSHIHYDCRHWPQPT